MVIKLGSDGGLSIISTVCSARGGRLDDDDDEVFFRLYNEGKRSEQIMIIKVRALAGKTTHEERICETAAAWGRARDASMKEKMSRNSIESKRTYQMHGGCSR